MGIVMHKGLPTNVKSLFGENQSPGIIVLDDLQSEIENIDEKRSPFKLEFDDGFSIPLPSRKICDGHVKPIFGFRNEENPQRLRFSN